MLLDQETMQDIVCAVKDIRRTMAGEMAASQAVDRAKAYVAELLTTLEMLGAAPLADTCRMLAAFLDGPVGDRGSEGWTAFISALDALADSLEQGADSQDEDLGKARVAAILEGGQAPCQEAAPQSCKPECQTGGGDLPDVSEMLAPALESGPEAGRPQEQEAPLVLPPLGPEEAPDGKPSLHVPWMVSQEEFFDSFKEHLEREGGVIMSQALEDGEEMVSITLPKAGIGALQTAFASSLADSFQQQGDDAISKKEGAFLVTRMLEFMKALAGGDIQGASNILESVTVGTPDFGLFGEIGHMARELHDALKEFSSTLDPEMKGLVEDKLPDSSLRLEHIIEITEKAASTTMDLTEVIQNRNDQEIQRLEAIRESFRDVRVLMGSVEKMMEGVASRQSGEAEGLDLLHGLIRMAHKQVAECGAAADAVMDSVAQTNKDLVSIFTAQDYQDLTGQVIQKIITLIQELENKLLSLVRRFGVKVGKAKSGPGQEELYGPSHAQRDDAVHSQDEVDDILKEFGF